MTDKTVEDLFLAVDLERLGCDSIADELRTKKTHDDASCLVMGLRELLERASASPDVLRELLELITSADEANLAAWRREQSDR